MENSANMKSKLILVISVLSSTCKGDGSTSRPPSTEILSDNFGLVIIAITTTYIINKRFIQTIR